MKGWNQLHNNQRGFTLVEMMAVVAITGVLAAVAIPAYNRQQALARQAEAKVQLGQIYAGQKSFHIENGRFTACLAAVGFGSEGAKYYAVGFGPDAAPPRSGDGWTGLSFRRDDLSIPLGTCSDVVGQTRFNATTYKRPAIGPALAALLPAGTFVTKNHYVVAAYGNIGLDAEDDWAVTEDKQVFNFTPGLDGNIAGIAPFAE